MAEPLTSEQRRQFEHYALSGKTPSIQHLGEWFEGYRAAEERADRLEEILRLVRPQLSDVDVRVVDEALAADDAARGES